MRRRLHRRVHAGKAMAIKRRTSAFISSSRFSGLNLFLVATCVLLHATAFGAGLPPLSKTELSATESAGFVVDSLPVYFSTKNGSIAKSNLHLKRLTANNLPAFDSELVQLLADSAIRVDDYEGRALYWDFSIKLRDGHILHVRAAANKALGTPILSISVHEPGSRRALDDLLKKGTKIAQHMPLFSGRMPTLIVHAYPRLGLLYELSSDRRVVFDLIRLSSYHIDPACRSSKQPRCAVWSPYDRLTSGRFEALVARFERVTSARRLISSTTLAQEQCVDLDVLQRKEQEYGVWCAAATGQAILEYHGATIANQFDVAVKMNPPPADVFFSMATDEGEANGYGELLPASLAARYVAPPEYEVVVMEIESKRPVRVGVHGHVRALACTLATGAEGSVLVYDPSSNEPDPYWEDWGSLLYEDTTCSYPGECDLILVQPE